MYDEISGNYRTDVLRLLAATEMYPIDIGLMYERVVVSPMDLSQRERHIHEIVKSVRLPQSRECDALIFGYGEPECRTVTKVGGLPYWPSWRPWPVSENDSPLEFLAQINFSGSESLVPPIPSKLLSLFIQESGFDFPTVYPIWQDIELTECLIDEEDLPLIADPIVNSPAFAVACRITEYGKSTLSKNIPYSSYWEYIATIRGSKIGGYPRYFSDASPLTNGVFLASLHSLRHPVEQPWPFVNVEDALTPEQLGGIGCGGGRGCHDTVMFGDQGTLYLFLEEDGTLRVKMQCWGLDELVELTPSFGSR